MNSESKVRPGLFDAEPPRPIRRQASATQLKILLIVLGILVLGIVAGAIGLASSSSPPKIGDYRVATVQAAPWSDRLELSGVVELAGSRVLSSPEKTSLISLDVEVGDTVKSGQIVMRFDASTLQTELTALTRSRDAREREIERLDVEAGFATRSAAASRSALLREEETARRNLELQRQLQASGNASADDIANAENRLAQASEAIARADLSSEQSRALYQLNRKSAVAELESAREAIADLNRRIEACTVRSPMAGTVLTISDTARESGAVLNQYTSLLTIADPASALIKVKLPDSRMTSVTKGLKVALTSDAGSFEGTVERIGATALTDDSTYGTYVDLWIRPPATMRAISGSTVSVTLELGQRDGVIQVARGPWFSGASQDHVYLLRGDLAVRTRIRTGSTSTSAIEILSGLKAGDRIITSAYSGFAAHESIQLEGAQP